MPRNARCVYPDLPYHVTQRGTNRQTVFQSAGDRRAYLGLVRQNLEDAGVRVLAYCLMTNHVHWVVVPDREDSLATLFRRVHGRYAQAWNARRQRSGHVWQNRFFSCPLEEGRLWIALRYVEQNPVRALLARIPEDYEWSSARMHLTGQRDRSGVLDVDFWRRSGGMETWREMHASAEDPVTTQLLRRCTYAGRPFGAEEFLGRIESKFGRKWRRWRFEDARECLSGAAGS
ncbi:MAG TPA: transposase [Bryobacteraceae bacterium]|jgi:putative transposase|nr:transposase [Bryobacteraceae bacterium]